MAHWDFIQLLCLCFASEILAGLVAGTYSGVNYGLQQALGENNWVCLFPQFGLSMLYTAKVLQKLFFDNWILIIITTPLIHFFLCRKLHCWVEHWLEQLWHLQSLTLAMIEWCGELLQEVQLPQLQLLFATSLIKTCIDATVTTCGGAEEKDYKKSQSWSMKIGPLCLANNNSWF